MPSRAFAVRTNIGGAEFALQYQLPQLYSGQIHCKTSLLTASTTTFILSLCKSVIYLIHSVVHSFIHSFIHPFIHPSIYSFIHPLTHSLTHAFTPSFILSFTHSLFHSFIHAFFLSLFRSFFSLAHLFFHPFNFSSLSFSLLLNFLILILDSQFCD